jgi:phosphoadenosine phosphosulfate reductase
MIDLNALNAQFEQADPETILTWAASEFGDRVVVSSSFQTQSVALLHLIAQVAPAIPVIFVDTGYHFPETLAYRDQLIDLLHIHVINVSADQREDFAPDGRRMYEADPDHCCAVHKVAPMGKALVGRDAWISGIRRDQTAVRRAALPIEQQKDGLYKVNPLLNWTNRDLWTYINRHNLPSHPLFSQGYMSIGCAPCTRPVTEAGDERSGRWAGRSKTECGLHTTDVRAEKNATN